MKKRHVMIQFIILLIVIAVIAAWTSIRTNESPGEYVVDDSIITTRVTSLLAEDDFLKSFQISAKTYQGTIQLNGYVNSHKAVDKAADIVKSVEGVTGIKNNLIVKQGKEKYHEVEYQG